MKASDIVNRIYNFDSFFNKNSLLPEYTRAWELNCEHEIKLNPLPPKSLEKIINIIKEKKPEIILEIGTGGAGTSISMAEESKEYDGMVYTIEKSLPKAEIARVHIKLSGLKNIELIEEDADSVIDKWSKKINLLFIDGNQKKYLHFLKRLEKFIETGGIVIADNVLNFGYKMEDFVEYMKNSKEYKTDIIDIENGLLIAIKT